VHNDPSASTFARMSDSPPPSGTLYLVATPIGNVEDLSPRARRLLGEVDRVAAEDTRHTGRLLKRLEIDARMVSLHQHNEAERSAEILGWLAAGEQVALVSDAGTPLVSDPGGRLVRAVREAGHCVVPIPGPSAVLAALTGSGLPWERFTFLGFIPRKGEARSSTLERIAGSEETTVMFESPERTARLLTDLLALCEPDREVAVARELTKLHEEFRVGTLADLADYHEREGIRGEVTVVVAPAPADREAPASQDLEEAAARLLDGGMRPSAAAKEIVARFGVPRNEAYQLVQSVQESADANEGERDDE